MLGTAPPRPSRDELLSLPRGGKLGLPGLERLAKQRVPELDGMPGPQESSTAARRGHLFSKDSRVPLWVRCPHGFLEPWELGEEASVPSRWLPDARAKAAGTQAPSMVRRGPHGSTTCT